MSDDIFGMMGSDSGTMVTRTHCWGEAKAHPPTRRPGMAHYGSTSTTTTTAHRGAPKHKMSGKEWSRMMNEKKHAKHMRGGAGAAVADARDIERDASRMYYDAKARELDGMDAFARLDQLQDTQRIKDDLRHLTSEVKALEIDEVKAYSPTITVAEFVARHQEWVSPLTGDHDADLQIVKVDIEACVKALSHTATSMNEGAQQIVIAGALVRNIARHKRLARETWKRLSGVELFRLFGIGHAIVLPYVLYESFLVVLAALLIGDLAGASVIDEFLSFARDELAIAHRKVGSTGSQKAKLATLNKLLESTRDFKETMARAPPSDSDE